MNRLMKRLEKIEQTYTAAAAQRACAQSKQLQSYRRQMCRTALSSMAINDFEILCELRSQDPLTLTDKQSATMDRFRAALDTCINAHNLPAALGQLKADAVPLRDVDCELAIQSFGFFIRKAWDVVEPAYPYIHNWHIDAIAEHLEAVTRGQIRKLLINIPRATPKACW